MARVLRPNFFVMGIPIALTEVTKDGVTQSMIQMQPLFVIWGSITVDTIGKLARLLLIITNTFKVV